VAPCRRRNTLEEEAAGYTHVAMQPALSAANVQGPQQPNGRPGPPLGSPQQPAQELTKTATIRNRANLKKNTLRLVPLAGDPSKLLVTFVFDNSAPCMCTLAPFPASHSAFHALLRTVYSM
jgi:hypothetical protein